MRLYTLTFSGPGSPGKAWGGVDVSPAALVCRVTDVDEEVSETMFWRFILDADR